MKSLFISSDYMKSLKKASFEFHTFTSKVIIYMKLVHGKPRHHQSQGSVERANAEIRKHACCIDC